MDSPAELFPFASPETVLAYLRRLEAKVLKIAPELSPAQCSRLIDELAISTVMLERISSSIEQSPEWKHRQGLPTVVPLAVARAMERLPQLQIERALEMGGRRRRRRGPHVSSSS